MSVQERTTLGSWKGDWMEARNTDRQRSKIACRQMVEQRKAGEKQTAGEEGQKSGAQEPGRGNSAPVWINFIGCSVRAGNLTET